MSDGVLWMPSILFLKKVDTWQLIINTATTIVTFLLVALLQNSQTRSDHAVQHKLNGLADVMAYLADGEQRDLHRDLEGAPGRGRVGGTREHGEQRQRVDVDAAERTVVTRVPHWRPWGGVGHMEVVLRDSPPHAPGFPPWMGWSRGAGRGRPAG